MIVVGCDPGTGVKSPTGLVCFNSVTKEIALFCTITSKHKTPENRTKDIATEVARSISFNPGVKNYEVFCIENFVMRGKGGQTLQRFIGAVLSHLPGNPKIMQPQNTAVKRIVAGKGDADKLEVGRGVAKYFEHNFDSHEIIQELIRREEWDILDAFAIGIAGISDDLR